MRALSGWRNTILVDAEGQAGIAGCGNLIKRNRWPPCQAAWSCWRLRVAALLFLAAATGWFVLVGTGAKTTEAARLSIVVMPFASLSGDPCAGLPRRRAHR